MIRDPELRAAYLAAFHAWERRQEQLTIYDDLGRSGETVAAASREGRSPVPSSRVNPTDSPHRGAR